jgi:hypothetical protein
MPLLPSRPESHIMTSATAPAEASRRDGALASTPPARHVRRAPGAAGRDRRLSLSLEARAQPNEPGPPQPWFYAASAWRGAELAPFLDRRVRGVQLLHGGALSDIPSHRRGRAGRGVRFLLSRESRLRIARSSRRTRARHDRTNPRTLATTMGWLSGQPSDRRSRASRGAMEAAGRSMLAGPALPTARRSPHEAPASAVAARAIRASSPGAERRGAAPRSLGAG